MNDNQEIAYYGRLLFQTMIANPTMKITEEQTTVVTMAQPTVDRRPHSDDRTLNTEATSSLLFTEPVMSSSTDDDTSSPAKVAQPTVEDDHALRVVDQKGITSKYNVDDTEYDTCFSVNLSPTTPSTRGNWTTDSTATAHMSYNPDCFHEIRQVSGRSILVGNGERIPVLGNGTVIVTSKRETMTLSDTLYAPGLKCNLFSLRAMHSSGKTVTFPWDDCRHVFVKNSRGKCLASGTLEKNKLYRMDFKCKARIDHAAYTSMDVWHQRMNHISESTIKKIAKDQLASGFHLSENKGTNLKTSNICVGCAKGKMARIYFMKRRSETLEKFKSYKEEVEKTDKHTFYPG